MKNIKLLILTGIFPPDVGGPAGYTRRMGDYFHSIGHRVDLLCFGDKRKIKYSFRVFAVSRRFPRPVRDLIYFFYALRLSINANIIFDNGAAYDTGYIAVLISKLLNIPVVTKIVGDGAWEFGKRRELTKSISIDEFLEEKKTNIILYFLQFIQRFVWKNVSKIIVPSDYLMTIMLKYGIKKEKIYVIKNNVNIPSKDLPQSLFKSDNDTFYFLTAARLVPWKGIDLLIKAFSRLPDKYKLIIAGDGPLKKDLLSLSKSLGISDRINFLGDISQPQVLSLMSTCTGFILNSSYEGLPHVILEAFKMRCPVIATMCGGTTELINNCSLGIKYGDLDKLIENIIRLSKDNELSKKIVEAQLDILKKISKNSMENDTAIIINELVS